MATYTATPGTVSQVATGDEAWTDLANVQTQDGSVATAGPGQGARQPIVCTNFSFGVGGSETVLGFTIRVRGYGSETQHNLDTGRLQYSGGDYGTLQTWTEELPTTLGDISVGGASDLMGSTPTPSVVNDSSFGVKLDFDDASSLGSDITYLDVIEMTVHTAAAYDPSDYIGFDSEESGPVLMKPRKRLTLF